MELVSRCEMMCASVVSTNKLHIYVYIQFNIYLPSFAYTISKNQSYRAGDLHQYEFICAAAREKQQNNDNER